MESYPDNGGTFSMSINVISPTNVPGYWFGAIRGMMDKNENVIQTKIWVNQELLDYWEIKDTTNSKIIWRCNGRSNVLTYESGSGQLIYSNAINTFPNIGSTSDSSTEYIIDIYPADYEDSGTYTMVYSSYEGGFVDNGFPGDEHQNENGTFYGYLYPITFMGKNIDQLYNEGGENRSLMCIRGAQSSLPNNIRITTDNVTSSIFHKNATSSGDDFTIYICDEYAIVGEGDKGEDKGGLLIKLEPL